MNKVSLTLWLGTLLFCFSCKQSTEVKSPKETPEKIIETLSLKEVINPTFDSLNVEPTRLSINAEQGGVLKLKGGTEIEIPAGAFVDQNDVPVRGDVDILVTEFNTLGDIILAGVNMKYDSAGVNYDFISAGMFHLDGEQNGDPIEIAKGKSIAYKMASNVEDLEDTPCYNFYKMDKEQNWNYIETKKAKDNPNYVKQERFVEPKEVSSNDLILELDMKGMKKYLNSDASVLWKYAGRRPDTINKKLLNEITANEVEVLKTDEHQLSYEIHAEIDNVNFVIPVEPVLMGKDLEKAKQSFNAKMKEIESSDETLRRYQQSQYIRSYSIPGFGMYNCDKIISTPRNTIIVDAGEIHGVPQEFCKFYLISKTDNSVILYNGSRLDYFRFNPYTDNHIVAINPNGQVSIVRSTSFFKQLNHSKSDRLKLKFQEIDGQVKHENEFFTIVNEL